MKKWAYYNDSDPNACESVRELIKAGHVAPGEVDERSITEVEASDLAGFRQVHFFSGIAVWSAALRLAGWPDDRPVWTGSCPCQDYSVAGKGEGASGDRDLWPVFAALIRECRPPVVLGEQVENAIVYGWLDRLRTDLEAEAYSVGGIVLGAHSAGADHIRQRLWWVGVSKDKRHERTQGPRRRRDDAQHTGPDGGLADVQRERGRCRDGERKDAAHAESRRTIGGTGEKCGDTSTQDINLWSDAAWLECRDGKARRIPIEPRLFPLADARTHKGYRVAALRGAGNAICLGTAAAFCTAVKGAIGE